MFHLLRAEKEDSRLLQSHDIFPRPTPWRVFFDAAWAYLTRRDAYLFVYIPARYQHLLKYDVYLEGDEVLLRQAGADVIHCPVLPMEPMTWAFFMAESMVSGLLLAVWNHRWSAGLNRMTRQEMIDRLERVEEERIAEELRAYGRVSRDDD